MSATLFIAAFTAVFAFQQALGASHAEGDDMTHGIRSPVGRHHLESMEHLRLFYAHDFCAFTSLFMFAVLWNMSKANPYHKWIGRLLAFPLIGAIITGFMLIRFRTSDAYVHIHAIQLGRMTISTQGYCVIGICINAFIYLRWVKEQWMNKALTIVHAFNVYMGIRSFQFLLCTYMKWNDYQANDANREVAFELLFALTIPQLLVDLSYLVIHFCISWNPKLVDIIEWREFHEMSVMGLIYICAIGVFFNVAHDAYYIFKSSGITDLKLRMMIILSPQFFNVLKYYPKINKSLGKMGQMLWAVVFDGEPTSVAAEEAKNSSNSEQARALPPYLVLHQLSLSYSIVTAPNTVGRKATALPPSYHATTFFSSHYNHMTQLPYAQSFM